MKADCSSAEFHFNFREFKRNKVKVEWTIAKVDCTILKIESNLVYVQWEKCL